MKLQSFLILIGFFFSCFFPVQSFVPLPDSHRSPSLAHRQKPSLSPQSLPLPRSPVIARSCSSTNLTHGCGACCGGAFCCPSLNKCCGNSCCADGTYCCGTTVPTDPSSFRCCPLGSECLSGGKCGATSSGSSGISWGNLLPGALTVLVLVMLYCCVECFKRNSRRNQSQTPLLPGNAQPIHGYGTGQGTGGAGGLSAQELEAMPVKQFHEVASQGVGYQTTSQSETSSSNHTANQLSSSSHQTTNQVSSSSSPMTHASINCADGDEFGDGQLPSCRICFEEFEATSDVRLLPCKHIFHDDCVDAWFRIRTTCPLCVQNISDLLKK